MLVLMPLFVIILNILTIIKRGGWKNTSDIQKIIMVLFGFVMLFGSYVFLTRDKGQTFDERHYEVASIINEKAQSIFSFLHHPLLDAHSHFILLGCGATLLLLNFIEKRKHQNKEMNEVGSERQKAGSTNGIAILFIVIGIISSFTG